MLSAFASLKAFSRGPRCRSSQGNEELLRLAELLLIGAETTRRIADARTYDRDELYALVKRAQDMAADLKNICARAVGASRLDQLTGRQRRKRRQHRLAGAPVGPATRLFCWKSTIASRVLSPITPSILPCDDRSRAGCRRVCTSRRSARESPGSSVGQGVWMPGRPRSRSDSSGDRQRVALGGVVAVDRVEVLGDEEGRSVGAGWQQQPGRALAERAPVDTGYAARGPGSTSAACPCGPDGPA